MLRPLSIVRLLPFYLAVVFICSAAPVRAASFTAARMRWSVTLDVTSMAQAWLPPASTYRVAFTFSAANVPLGNKGSDETGRAANLDIATPWMKAIVATKPKARDLS